MKFQRAHIVGIGGIGLSAIARILISRGVLVTGSDQVATPITNELADLGVKIAIGHRPENIRDADLLLISSAVKDDNPEVVQAKRLGIRIAKRYDLFPELTAGKKTIAVAGTHGKTTTSAMIGLILTRAGLDPDIIVGGIISELGGNARAGKGDWFVIEADEYDRAFLGLRPNVAVVTSIEMDHPDIYRDVEDVESAFREFMQLVQIDGHMIGCGDYDRVEHELRKLAHPHTIRYGFGASCDWRATQVGLGDSNRCEFVAHHLGEQVGKYALRVPGRHNILNALAAIATADAIGVDMSTACATLADFRGAARRFEVKGEFHGVAIVDDYAHHPTEIRATLAAARMHYQDRKLWAVFQPHTFSRTRALMHEFSNAFADCDHVIVSEVYAAREHESGGTSGAEIVARMNHADARFISSLDATVDYLLSHLDEGDVLITLGAGDVNRVGEQVAQEIGA
jgi:UDP-N-acetylmuramate--alanine ligase